jgi:hypothetical protein
MATNFLAPTPAELEREWGQTLSEEWNTDIVAGDFAPDHPPLRRRRSGAARDRPGPLRPAAGIGQGVRPPGSTVNARTETAATRSAFKGRWAGRQWCIVRRSASTFPTTPTRRRSPNAGASAAPDRSPVRHRGPVGPLGRRGRRIDAELLDPHPQLRPPSLLSRFHRANNDKGEPQEKRTPVLLAEEDFDAWLDTTPAARDVLRNLQQGRPRGRAGAEQPRAATTTMPLDTAISDF